MALDRGHLYKRGKIWWVKWSPVRGDKPERRSTGCRDKRGAEAKARSIMHRHELLLAGVEITEDLETVEALVDRWEAYLVRRKRTERHARASANLVRDYASDERITYPSQITLPSAEAWLESMAAKRGWAKRTFNCNRGYLVAFSRWLANRAKVLPRSPLEGVEAQDRGGDVYVRRALEGDASDLVAGQGRALVEAAPWPWSALWLTYLSTGLRRGEADGLEWRDVSLRKKALVVRWEVGKAGYGGREDLLPISDELAGVLAELLEQRRLGVEEDPDQLRYVRQLGAEGLSIKAIEKRLQTEKVERAAGGVWWWQHVAAVLRAKPREVEPTERVFQGLPMRKLSRYLHPHLAAAGIEKKTPEGVIDQHSLRKTFAVQLRRRGVHPFTIQRLMRHQDPRLTAGVYQTHDQLELRPAVQAPAARREA